MLEKKLAQYAKTFGDGFPMCPLGWDKSDDDIVAIIDECLDKKKDVYELGYLDDEDEIY